jgi:hypothetical protein
MEYRALIRTLFATLLLGFAVHASGQNFTSISGATPAAAAPAAATPEVPAVLAPSAAPVAAPAFDSVSSHMSSLPPPAATLAFSSVSSLNAGANPTGSGPSLPAAASRSLMADRILIEKGARRLFLLNRGQVIAEYPVKLGLSPKGHKQFEGDFRTPEGVYHLSRRNPRSEFFLSVEVSYPNEADRARAAAEGLRPGGLIMIHGQPNVPRKPPEYYATRDWTDGCIAVSNAAMVEIWQRTRIGIPIEIRP